MQKAMSEFQISAPDFSGEFTVEYKVSEGMWLYKGTLVAILKRPKDEQASEPSILKVKTEQPGKVVNLLKPKGGRVKSLDPLVVVSSDCSHPTVMKNMCAECGADLLKEDLPRDAKSSEKASVAVLHSIPELKVSSDEAVKIGKEDEARLMNNRKLVLLVDLDQTLIHTTHENVPGNIKDVHHFQLSGVGTPWYHTKIRPGTSRFLENISKCYELHICTFGARLYAHTIAKFLDNESKYFSHRILSRDECFDSRSKTANLSSLFPCGDHMVCIIDDREDVWNFAPNLVHVKPYNFFKNTGDINAPPGLSTRIAETSSAKENFKEKSLKEDFLRATDTLEEDLALKGDVEVGDKSGEKKTEETNASDSNDSSNLAVASIREDLEVSDEESSSESENGDSENITEPKSKEDSNTQDSDTTRNKVIGSCEVTGPSKSTKKTPASEMVEVEDTDDYLLYLEDILKTIHKAYYELYDQLKSDGQNSVPDLKNVIPYVKRKIIPGTNIVFSGVVPTHLRLEKSKPYLVAKSLGAQVSDQIKKDTTHLVAAKLGTNKVHEARKNPNIKLVTPDWLWACAERWEHVEEALFPVIHSATVTLTPPAHCSSPEIAFSERCPPVPKELVSDSRMPETLNPFLAFSSEDLKGMGDEIEDVLSDDSSSSSDGNLEGTNLQNVEESSSDESLSGDTPHGHKRKFAELEPDDNATDIDFARSAQDDNTDDDLDNDADWSRMGAELERKFLDDNSSSSLF